MDRCKTCTVYVLYVLLLVYLNLGLFLLNPNLLAIQHPGTVQVVLTTQDQRAC